MKKTSTEQPIRVAILEHNLLARESLTALIHAEKTLDSVGSYASVEETIK